MAKKAYKKTSKTVTKINKPAIDPQIEQELQEIADQMLALASKREFLLEQAKISHKQFAKELQTLLDQKRDKLERASVDLKLEVDIKFSHNPTDPNDERIRYDDMCDVSDDFCTIFTKIQTRVISHTNNLSRSDIDEIRDVVQDRLEYELQYDIENITLTDVTDETKSIEKFLNKLDQLDIDYVALLPFMKE